MRPGPGADSGCGAKSTSCCPAMWRYSTGWVGGNCPISSWRPVRTRSGLPPHRAHLGAAGITVERQLQADVPLCTFLSGGLDSVW